ncbi:hypothetical protein ACJMK2_043679 [Sinanodonta woodiana]|uniref:Tyrosine-protein phosphatase non-receptor type 9 n=1 Tax=Sinanodonta woodiana TaxID=1069815 RepID=A0ABD3VXM9_SINWO
MACLSLTIEEEKVVQTFLDKVNKDRRQKNESAIAWNTGLKFVSARKFSLQRAVELYAAHQLTREKEGLLHIDINDNDLIRELDAEKFTILSGRDGHGAAIALFTARKHFPATTTHELVLKALIYQLDVALESTETQRHGIIFMYDMTDSKFANFDYDLCVKILNLLKGAYPARLKKVLIVTAPLWFKAPFKILRLFVREKLRERVHTVDKSQLLLHIPRDSLPKCLGGALVVDHRAWLEICRSVSLNQTADINNYFISRGRLSTSNSSVRKGSTLSRNSFSSDLSENHSSVFASDSEDSKETISEKQSAEEREKEIEKIDESTEKEVNFEKEDSLSLASKRRLEADKGTPEDRRKHMTSASAEDNIDIPHSSPNLPRKKRPTSSGLNIYEDSIHMPEEGGLSIDDLVKRVQQMRKKGLMEEYAQIKREQPAGTFQISKAKYNLPKNRYSDVLCLDHSRVSLPSVSGDPSSDYINANFVDGYRQKNAYISTQGPLPKTFGDFWRMVWEVQSVVIVMTTKTMERGRVKCGQYWPEGEESEAQYDEFNVINTGIEQNRDYTITGLLLHNSKVGLSRQVTHLQFTSWPDYGIPPATGFLDFLFRVRACQADATKMLCDSWRGHPNGPPMVVHCSAGIGRTGTFITIDISLHRLGDIGTVNIYETVRRIRSQRAFSIQMPDQYVFCHLGVIDYAVKNGLISDVNWASFEDSESDSDEI